MGGEAFLDKKILASMALAPESSRLASWLVPPVQVRTMPYISDDQFQCEREMQVLRTLLSIRLIWRDMAFISKTQKQWWGVRNLSWKRWISLRILNKIVICPSFQVGPFVYKAVTIKDSVNKSNGESNLVYGEDGKTLTYRPRWAWAVKRQQTIMPLRMIYRREV